jgi:hypothetical protein
MDSGKFLETVKQLDEKLKYIGVIYAFVDENTTNVASNQKWRDVNILLNKYLETFEVEEEALDKFYDTIESYEADETKINRYTLASLLLNIDPSIQSIFSQLQESVTPKENKEIGLNRNFAIGCDSGIAGAKVEESGKYGQTIVSDDLTEEDSEITPEELKSEYAKPKKGNEILLESISQKVGELRSLMEELITNPPENFEFDRLNSQDPQRAMAWLVDKDSIQQIKLINQFIEEYTKISAANLIEPEEIRVKRLCLAIRQKQKEVNKLASTLTELNKGFIWHKTRELAGGVDIGKSNDLIYEQPFGDTKLSYDDVYSIAYLQFYNAIFNKATSGPYKDYSLLTYAGSKMKYILREISQNSSLIRLPPDEFSKLSIFKKSELKLLQNNPKIVKNSDEYYAFIIEDMKSRLSKKSKESPDLINRKYIEKALG